MSENGGKYYTRNFIHGIMNGLKDSRSSQFASWARIKFFSQSLIFWLTLTNERIKPTNDIKSIAQSTEGRQREAKLSGKNLENLFTVFNGKRRT